MSRLARVRRVLAMDADDALDRPIGAYVDLFRKHPVRMHVLGAATMLGILGAFWLLAGGRAALLMLAFICLVPLLLATAHFLRGRRDRSPR